VIFKRSVDRVTDIPGNGYELSTVRSRTSLLEKVIENNLKFRDKRGAWACETSISERFREALCILIRYYPRVEFCAIGLKDFAWF
jgi:hypothetical protein